MESIRLAPYEAGDEKMLKALSDLADGYAEQGWQKYSEYLVEFPQAEGYAETAKKDAVFTIVRDFLEWCSKRQP